MTHPEREGEAVMRPEQSAVGEGIVLSLWERSAAGLFGVLVMACGLWALTRGTDGPGTVAALICALVLLILAVLGQAPQRIWGKDMGIILERVRRDAKSEGVKFGRFQTLDLVTVPTSDLFIRRLVSRTDILPADFAAQIQEFRRFHRAAAKALAFVIRARGGDRIARRDDEPDPPWHIIIINDRELHILVRLAFTQEEYADLARLSVLERKRIIVICTASVYEEWESRGWGHPTRYGDTRILLATPDPQTLDGAVTRLTRHYPGEDW